MERVLNISKEAIEADLVDLDIVVPRDKLIEFCRKAVCLPGFRGLRLREEDGALVLHAENQPGEVRIPTVDATINITTEYFKNSLPPQIYLTFEGLARIFNGTYVATYKNDPEHGTCKVSIIDGIYTHCGARCLIRHLFLPDMAA